ncbi:universal stress protein [Weissella hellenica]|uniref:Universal stress protein n=1 Tax=Weissella hellenica TaxID=46256 RepID=A0A4Y4G1H8_WEIHE|nr:universal stress protein [Weissella hellenica]NKY67137.1 universal stress protein [Weissella hellenica]GED36252.1 universal stress protein [Weissella hellenica]SCB98336.1 Nucleotide-binding universal stress protein, UspA family [Weissella hellenica]
MAEDKIAYKNILAPIDGSKISSVIIEKAAAVAVRNQTALDLLYVIDTNSISGLAGMSISGDVVYQLVQDAEEKLTKFAQIARDNGAEQVNIHVRFGSPKAVIARDFPRDHDTGLIMLGKSGLNTLERILVGSVTSFVVQNAKTDVLIVQ